MESPRRSRRLRRGGENEDTPDEDGRLHTAETAKWGGAKWREIDKAIAARAADRRHRAEKGLPPLPTAPYHSTRCGSRTCRPGEGNIKHAMDRQGRFKQWEQPYEHSEMYVQSRSRVPPHSPGDMFVHTAYAGLVAAARAVAVGGLVMIATADFDFRLLALNWYQHARQLGYRNALIYSMDSECHAHLSARSVPSFDGSALLNAWNHTCLQRHIQAVRMERQVAAAALLAAGLDVLVSDASCVFLRDFVPFLRQQPADVLLQRDDWPLSNLGSSLESGAWACTAANAGFVYLRSGGDAARIAPLTRLVKAVVDRGLIEFYLRWNNVVDQYGWSHVLASALSLPAGKTSEFVNETTLGVLEGGGYCRRAGSCLRVGLLPYASFPRHDRGVGWPSLAGSAYIYHLPGPSRGLRQRLNRYDDVDFEGMVSQLRRARAWLGPTSVE